MNAATQKQNLVEVRWHIVACQFLALSQDQKFYEKARADFKNALEISIQPRSLFLNLVDAKRVRYSRPKKSLEVNWRLTLSIPDGVSSTNMQGLLDRYFGEQETDELLTIDPEERAELQKQYGKCHAKEPAHRQMNVYRLPTSVLINVVKFNCNLVLSARVLICVCRLLCRCNICHDGAARWSRCQFFTSSKCCLSNPHTQPFRRFPRLPRLQRLPCLQLWCDC